EVLQDLLQLLKESVSSQYSERLEQIVIALTSMMMLQPQATPAMMPRQRP
ncbi:hypothetical protein EDB85DRAFT_1871908, partial [Lactarius pseudohatsudake]